MLQYYKKSTRRYCFTFNEEWEVYAVLRTDFVRRKKNMMKINECFSYDKVKDVSDSFFRQCKYYGSDYNSDESIHYAEGHCFNYHENDKIKVKKIKR